MNSNNSFDQTIVSQTFGISFVNVAQIRQLMETLNMNRSEVIRLAIQNLYDATITEQPSLEQ